MNIEVTFDIVKWVVSGVILAGTTAFTWVAKKALAHIKEQKENSVKADLFRNDIADRVEKIIEKTDGIATQMQSLQVFMDTQFEVSPVAMFICDNTGKCTDANDSLLAIFKAKLSEMTGFGWQNFLHPEDRGRVHDSYMKAIAANNGDIRDHYRIIDRDEYDTNGRIILVCSVVYKTIFKYGDNGELKVAVGTVWEIDNQESDSKVIRCIAKTLDAMHGTPLWMEMQQQIKNKSK